MSRSVASRLTSDPARDFSPVWTQDGRQIVFGSARTGASLLRRQADGARPEEVLVNDDGLRRPQAFASRDTLVMEEVTAKDVRRLVAVSLSSGRRDVLLEGVGRNAVVSRDGSWLAYQSTESGQSEVYVRPFPRVSDQRWQVSAEGGVEPLWSPQGDELFYRSLDGQLLSVPVRVGPTFVAEEARPLIEARYPVGTSVDGRIYDVSPDGRRFLMVKEGGGKIVVVQNWFTELNRLVPPSP